MEELVKGNFVPHLNIFFPLKFSGLFLRIWEIIGAALEEQDGTGAALEQQGSSWWSSPVAFVFRQLQITPLEDVLSRFVDQDCRFKKKSGL